MAAAILVAQLLQPSQQQSTFMTELGERGRERERGLLVDRPVLCLTDYLSTHSSRAPILPLFCSQGERGSNKHQAGI